MLFKHLQGVLHLCDILRGVLLEVHRASDLQVGLSIQVGGLDEAHLHPANGKMTQ